MAGATESSGIGSKNCETKNDFKFSVIDSVTVDCDGTHGWTSYSRGYGMDDGFSFNAVDSMFVYFVYSTTFLYYRL